MVPDAQIEPRLARGLRMDRISVKTIDGHSHMYQTYAMAGELKETADEIDGFDIDLLLGRLDAMGVSHFQTMPQEMTRIRGLWLGSNELSVDLQRRAPARVVAYAGAEPVDVHGVFNRKRLGEVRQSIVEGGLRGLLLTPPYGHYYANDRQVYPFYELAVELDIPIYFHHSHNFGPPKNCPLKYAQVGLLDDVIMDFPELRLNVEHMGYPWTEELLAMMARSPNVYTDIAMFVDPYPRFGRSRHLLLARNLGMAREYGVLDRVFYGSDYVGEDMDEYAGLLQRELDYLRESLNSDMERQGFPALGQEEMQGLLATNVLRLWGE